MKPKESAMAAKRKQFNNTLYAAICEILESARKTAYKAVNTAMVQAYWQIGRLILEDEQQGEQRARYGKKLLEELAVRLTAEFGKGFTVTNLKYMRSFFRAFPNGHALRDELSWTHYRLLLKVENPDARTWYMNEAAEGNWSSRQLERQIYLPTEDELKKEIERERNLLDENRRKKS